MLRFGRPEPRLITRHVRMLVAPSHCTFMEPPRLLSVVCTFIQPGERPGFFSWVTSRSCFASRGSLAMASRILRPRVHTTWTTVCICALLDTSLGPRAHAWGCGGSGGGGEGGDCGG